MSEDARIDRLAEALEAIIADPRAPLRPADAELAELLRIAQDLHDLPNPAFKARLGADLSRRATMTSTTDTTAEAIQSVTARLEAPSARWLAGHIGFAPGMAAMTAGLGHRRPAVIDRFVERLQARLGSGPIGLNGVAFIGTAVVA
jgi:hypothetical protein